jgi:hypothetical protein
MSDHTANQLAWALCALLAFYVGYRAGAQHEKPCAPADKTFYKTPKNILHKIT